MSWWERITNEAFLLAAIAWLFNRAYLVPLALGVWMTLTQRMATVHRYVWWALACSVAANIGQELLQREGHNTWFVLYLFPVPQMVLCLLALADRTERDTVALLALMLAVGTVYQITRGGADLLAGVDPAQLQRPDFAVYVMGSVPIAGYAIRLMRTSTAHRWLGRGMFVYWGVALPVFASMPLAEAFSECTAAGCARTIWSWWLRVVYVILMVGLGMLTAWLWQTRRRRGVRLA